MSLPFLSPRLFFFPEFYNSAVRNCFWLKLGSKSLISGQEWSPSPPSFQNPFLSVRFKPQKSRAEGEGSTLDPVQELVGSACFHNASAARYFFQLKQGWFLHNVARVFLCMCLCLSRKWLSHFCSKAVLLCEPLACFLVLLISHCCSF